MAGTGVGKYSTTASSNETVQSTNFAEGMAPSDVNNAARETMANMRSMYNQIGEGFVEYGDGDGEYTVTRSDADTITITSSANLTSLYYAGRPIRILDGGGNTVTGAISSSSYSSPNLTVNLSGISLASGNPTRVELGPAIKAGGGRVILDDDEDSYLSASTDDQIDVVVSGTAQLEVKDGSIGPTTDSDVDLGTTAKRFKDAFVDTLTTDTLNLSGDLTVSTLLKMPDVTAGKILVGDGTSYEEVAISGDATLDSSGALTIASGAIEESMLATGVGGKLLQVAVFSNQDQFSTTSNIPADGTTPTVSEGIQVASRTFTPTASNSTLIHVINAFAGGNSGGAIKSFNIFRDSTNIGAFADITGDNGHFHCLMGQTTESAASTSEITYTLRFGTNNNTVYWNRASGTNSVTASNPSNSSLRWIIYEIGA